eukprot:TRINITY_DN1324_c0_g2_i1.p2 TRINITY_DN1324_c0_g2~~TRINITY_DN1324_c0_g2_i1.p2  ORF type:complete len:246 (-),score=35.26 TRINITY_DN1324_c0_g2_i1:409-1092(-)
MNGLELDKQLEQMVRFIQQEAQEKAKEIKVSAEEDFNLEKLQMLEKEKQKIRAEYQRREAQIEVQRKIQFSKKLNEQRLEVLKAREAVLKEIGKEVRGKLLELSQDTSVYKDLIIDLLVQAMQRLANKKQVVKCRQEDVSLVQDCLKKAQQKFKKRFNVNPPQLTLDKDNYLPPSPVDLDDEDTPSCVGGIVVTSVDGRIVCSNTLDDRLEICYAQNLPTVRSLLFE